MKMLLDLMDNITDYSQTFLIETFNEKVVEVVCVRIKNQS